MAIGWHEINGKFYFFNGKGQMQTNRWIFTKDSWDEHSRENITTFMQMVHDNLVDGSGMKMLGITFNPME